MFIVSLLYVIILLPENYILYIERQER